MAFIAENAAKNGAYRNREDLTDVLIPDGVTEIGECAFEGCTGLKSVIIPASVTKILNGAFYGCTGLSSVVISAGVTKIQSGAFFGCTGLSSIVIPAGVTAIRSNAFYGCTGLSSIVIPDSVVEIDENVFSNCPNLKEIHTSERIRKMLCHMHWDDVCDIFKNDLGGFHRLSALESKMKYDYYQSYPEEYIQHQRSVSLENDANREIRLSVFPDHDCDDIFFRLKPQRLVQLTPVTEEQRRSLKSRRKWERRYLKTMQFSVHAAKAQMTGHLDEILALTGAISGGQGIRMELKKWYCTQRDVRSLYAKIPWIEIENEQKLLEILSAMKEEYGPMLEQIRAFYPKAGEKKLRLSHHPLSERTKKKRLPPDGQPLP